MDHRLGLPWILEFGVCERPRILGRKSHTPAHTAWIMCSIGLNLSKKVIYCTHDGKYVVIDK